MSARLLPLILALFLTILVAGCSDDDECPTCPDCSDDPVPTFANIWPHADQNSWSYDLLNFVYEGDPDELIEPGEPTPEMPSMEELHARLAEPIEEELLGSSEGLYRIHLDGDITTDSGVTAQNFVDETISPDELTSSTSTASSGLLGLILSQRPDCRARWLELGRPLPSFDKDFTDELGPPFLLNGYAFAATDTGFFGYGDISQNYSWTYLEESLEVGHEFSRQLIPELADDIFLYGRIWSRTDLEIGDRLYRNCVECFYLIDMGLGSVTDEQGNLLGKARIYMYGSIYYAPWYGPVLCHQRDHVIMGLIDVQPAIVEFKTELNGQTITWP